MPKGDALLVNSWCTADWNERQAVSRGAVLIPEKHPNFGGVRGCGDCPVG